MIRAAIVGVSGYGRWHLLMAMEQALVGRLRLVGATVINQAEESVACARFRRQGVPVFADFGTMIATLAGHVDLVLVPTGIQWHAAMTIAALRAGAHVLVEKPVAATLQDVDVVMATQRETGRTVAVGFQDLYVPVTHEIKRRVLAGEIGPLQRIIVRAQWPRPTVYYERNTWAGHLRSEGGWVLDSPVSNAYAHFLMLALFWAGGKPGQAAAIERLQAELYRVNAIESFDTICFRARTATGIEILFYGSHAGREDLAPEIRLVGEHGEITWTYEKSYVVSPRDQAPGVYPVPGQLDTRLSVLEAVVGSLRGDSHFVVEPGLAREHTRVLNALHEFFPIQTVDAQYIVPEERPGGSYRRLQDLDHTIAEAAKNAALFSETGAPWAVRGTSHTLAGYDLFAGCYPAASMVPGDVRALPATGT